MFAITCLFEKHNLFSFKNNVDKKGSVIDSVNFLANFRALLSRYICISCYSIHKKISVKFFKRNKGKSFFFSIPVYFLHMKRYI